MRAARRLAFVAAGAVIAVPLAYLLTALVLGLIPVHPGFRSDPNGIAIYVRTNGVHAELVLPTQAAGVSWSEDFPAAHMRHLPAPLPWIAFGWGDREFFVTTPTWRELRTATAMRALSGRGDGAMHVEYIERPRAYRGREVRLSALQYGRLVDYVRASIARDASGRPVRLDANGYFEADAFYAAVPRYSFWLTSNDWVRRGLTQAGVRTPRWSPFDVALFYQLDRL